MCHAMILSTHSQSRAFKRSSFATVSRMSATKHQVKRTYGFRVGGAKASPIANSSDTSPSSTPVKPQLSPAKRKRPLADLPSFSNGPPPRKKVMLKKSATKVSAKKPTLTQLHFCIDSSIMKSCSLCNMTYTHGAPDDESLHKSHCARVQRGTEWGREEERGLQKSGGSIVVVDNNAQLRGREQGRIVSVKANAGKKLGQKVSAYLKSMNVALSAPDMDPATYENARIYLFLLRSQGDVKEKIVGGLIAQHISSAMRIATKEEMDSVADVAASMIHVEGNLYCRPEQIRTPMGIPRLFVSSTHRRKGIAQLLLTAAAKTFIHGCELDPEKGEVAFSQPTSMGRVVMEKWGKGGVRVYEE